MLFQYIGDGKCSPKECEIFDYHFILNGEPVDVTNERAIRKLMGNKTFLFEPTLVSAPPAPAVNEPEPEIKAIEFKSDVNYDFDVVTGDNNVVDFKKNEPEVERSVCQNIEDTFCSKVIKKIYSWYK